MSKKQYYMGQEILGHTNLFGKDYFWMRDGDGTVYLAHSQINEQGVLVPRFI